MRLSLNVVSFLAVAVLSNAYAVEAIRLSSAMNDHHRENSMKSVADPLGSDEIRREIAPGVYRIPDTKGLEVVEAVGIDGLRYQLDRYSAQLEIAKSRQMPIEDDAELRHAAQMVAHLERQLKRLTEQYQSKAYSSEDKELCMAFENTLSWGRNLMHIPPVFSDHVKASVTSGYMGYLGMLPPGFYPWEQVTTSVYARQQDASMLYDFDEWSGTPSWPTTTVSSVSCTGPCAEYGGYMEITGYLTLTDPQCGYYSRSFSK